MTLGAPPAPALAGLDGVVRPLTDGAVLLGSTGPGDVAVDTREVVDATVAADCLDAVLAADICLARLAAVDATAGTAATAPAPAADPLTGAPVLGATTAGRTVLGCVGGVAEGCRVGVDLRPDERLEKVDLVVGAVSSSIGTSISSDSSFKHQPSRPSNPRWLRMPIHLRLMNLVTSR